MNAVTVLSGDTVVTRLAGVRARKFRGRLLVANRRVGFQLDEISERIFALVDGSRTVTQIAAAIAADYDADMAEVEADVKDLLHQLLAEDLVGRHG